MIDKGKALEGKFSRWMKELDIYCIRFFDSRSVGGISAPRPADYFIYFNDKLMYIELKHTEKMPFPLSNVRVEQYKSCLKAEKYGFRYIILIEYKNTLYGGLLKDFIMFSKSNKRKSLPLNWFINNFRSIKNKYELKNYFKK